MPQRSFLKDISSVFGSNILALFNALLVDIVISRQLGPEGRGLYTSILVVPLIVVSFALLGIRRSAVYHLGQKTYDENRTVSGILTLMIITSLVGMLVSGIALRIMHPPGLSIGMLVLVLLSIPVKLILIYSGGIYIGKEDFRKSNLQVWLPQFLNFLGIILFTVLLRWDVLGALLSLFISTLLVALASLSNLNRRYSISIRFDREVLGSLARLGFIYAIATVVMQLNYRVDIMLLQKLSVMKEVGYYSLGVAISDKLWQLPSAIGLVVMSRSANTTDEGKLNLDVARLLRLTFLLVLAVSILIWLIIPWLLPLVFGEKFMPSVAIVRWMLPGILMFAIVRILSGRFAGKGEPFILICIFVPALLLNILLNFIWIPAYGGVGAAWASNVSYSAGAIALLTIFSIRMHIPFREILRYRSTDFTFLKNYIQRIKQA
jgi:O-antigen/teichoic acid export membrane protein